MPWNEARRALIIDVVALACLAACGSTPATEHYYSIVLSADSRPSQTISEATKGRLIVGPVQLPAYLNQPGLVMQTGRNQIQTANHHFWAEPLDEAIVKVLVQDISRIADGIAVDSEAGRWTTDGDCRVRVEFDKFHATTNSRVVSSGRYWLYNSDESTKEEFALTSTLTADGYGHAVEVMRETVRTLAEQISQAIDGNMYCAGT